jgi:SAM-dependent methyltransferase
MAGTHRKEWFDEDAFWEELYPFMFDERRFAAADEQCDPLLALAAPTGKRVLDLCCGPGRFCVATARRGYAVTGVDRTSFLLGKARALAQSEGLDVEFVQIDLVLSLFTSFGYFDDKDEDLGVLRNILANLAEGGKLLIDVMGKERLARIYQPTVSEVLEDGSMLVQRHEIIDDWTRVRNEWIVIRGGTAKRYPFHHTIYSGEELRALLQRAGFRDVKLFGDFEGGEYGVNARRLLAVAGK